MYQSHPQYAAGVGANAEYYGASTAAAEGGYAFREQAGEEIGHGREGRLITALEGNPVSHSKLVDFLKITPAPFLWQYLAKL